MKVTRLTLAASLLVMAGMLAGLMAEHRASEKVATIHDSLIEQIARLKRENEVLSSQIARPKQTSATSNEPFNELLRLRGQVGALRQQTNDIARLQRENEKLMAQTDATQGPSFNDLSPKDQFTLRQTHMQEAVNTLSEAIKNYMSNHNSQPPANFDQLIGSGDLQVTNFAGNLSLNDFEFLKPGTVDRNGDPVILRNRVAIPSPKEDPQWKGDPIWVYVVAGDQLSIVTTPGDFANSGSVQNVPASATPDQ